MTSSETEVQLTVQKGTKTIRLERIMPPKNGEDHEVELEVVTGLEIPGSEPIHNPRHSTHLRNIRLGREMVTRTVTLSDERAERLAKFYSMLREHHGNDSLGFLSRVEGWAIDPKGFNCSQALFKHPSIPEPGDPYAVMAQGFNEANGKNIWKRTHSAIATDDHQLLSIQGTGSVLALMDAETTLRLYGGGGEGYFSKAYSPHEVHGYTFGIVPIHSDVEFVSGFITNEA